jgi:hypothetical protein
VQDTARARREELKSESPPLTKGLRTTLQALVDQVTAQGPPPEWGCPRPPVPAVLPGPAFLTPSPTDQQLIG